MAQSEPKSVDQYLAGFSGNARVALEDARAAIREAIPGAEECISYQMLGYRGQRILLYLGGFTDHYSLFGPNIGAVIDAFSEELARYPKSKGTIRFPLAEAVPADLIARIARRCLEEDTRRQEEKRRSRSPGRTTSARN